jgi:putative membrane protein
MLRHLLLAWIANAIALAVVGWLFQDVSFDGFWSLVWAAALFGILNTILKPVLRLITLPLALLTLGIAWFFVSLLMLAITNWLVSGFTIHGFWTFVWATVVIWAVNVVLDLIGLRGLRRTAAG